MAKSKLSFFRGGDADVTYSEVECAVKIGQVDRDVLDNMLRLIGGKVEDWWYAPDLELLLFIGNQHDSAKSFNNCFKTACKELIDGNEVD